MASGEATNQLASQLQVLMQLAGHAGQHAAVAVLLGNVEAAEQPPADGDKVSKQALTFGLTQGVQVNRAEIRRGAEQLGPKLCRKVIVGVPVQRMDGESVSRCQRTHGHATRKGKINRGTF